eukprot:276417_1
MAENPGGRRMSKREEYVMQSREVNEIRKKAESDKADDKNAVFKPMQTGVLDMEDIPEYDPNARKLSKLEIDDMKEKFENQMQALIENPKQARRSFITDQLIAKQEEKKSDLNTIAEQLVKARKEDEKEVELPPMEIDETFKDSNLWEKTLEYISKSTVKIRWMFVVKKDKEQSHSIELIHTQGSDSESKTERKIVIDGKDVLSEETATTEYTQLFGGNVHIINIVYNKDDKDGKIWSYDLKINNETHERSEE